MEKHLQLLSSARVGLHVSGFDWERCGNHSLTNSLTSSIGIYIAIYIPLPATSCYIRGSIPVGTRHLYNIYTMSNQRRIRWAAVV